MIRTVFIIFAASGLLLASSPSRQILISSSERAVTAKVKKTFQKASVSAPQKIKRSGKTFYSYEVKQGRNRCSFVYTETGVPIEKRVGIAPTSLPKKIKARLQKLYPNAAVLAVQKTVKGKKTTYFVALRLEGQRFEVMLDMLGRRTLLKA